MLRLSISNLSLASEMDMHLHAICDDMVGLVGIVFCTILLISPSARIQEWVRTICYSRIRCSEER